MTLFTEHFRLQSSTSHGRSPREERRVVAETRASEQRRLAQKEGPGTSFTRREWRPQTACARGPAHRGRVAPVADCRPVSGASGAALSDGPGPPSAICSTVSAWVLRGPRVTRTQQGLEVCLNFSFSLARRKCEFLSEPEGTVRHRVLGLSETLRCVSAEARRELGPLCIFR